MGVEADRAEVEPALGHDRGQVAEGRLERRRVRVGVHEDERAPGAYGHGREREARGVEARLALRARRSPQRAVQVVGPRVVRALKRLAAPGPLDDEVASVTADVDEPAERLRPTRGRRRRGRARSAPRSTTRARRPTPPAPRTSKRGRRSARARARGRRVVYQRAGSVHPSSSGRSSSGIDVVTSVTRMLAPDCPVSQDTSDARNRASGLVAGRDRARRRDPARGVPRRGLRRRE